MAAKPSRYLETARTVYAKKGARLSLADIAAAARVSRPTIYRHLGGKAEILARLNGADTADIDARIMRGVLEVAKVQGFKAATIEAIAMAADVGPATIYRRFSDKETLIRTFIARHTPRNKLPDFPPDASGDFCTELAALIRHIMGFMIDNKTLVRLIFSGSAADRAYLHALRDDTYSTFSRLNGFFQMHQNKGHISAKITPEFLTTNLFGMIYAQAIVVPSGKALETEAACRSIFLLFQPLVREGHDA